MRNCISIDDWRDFAMIDAKKKRWNYAAPVLIWDKKYEKNPAAFLELVRRVSDWLLFSGNSVFDREFPNRPDLSEIVRGAIKPIDYHETDYVFGRKSFMPIKDNHFYEGPKNFVLGRNTSIPFKFHTKSVDNEFARELRKQAAQKTAEAIMNVSFDSLAAQGYESAQGLNYKGIDTNQPLNKVLANLNPLEQIEYLVQAILLDLDHRHNFKEISHKCLDNRFDIRSCFAAVGIEYGELVPKHLPPAQVRWIANKPIETFEDPAVLAVGYHSFLNMEEALVKYGADLFKSHGVVGLKAAIKKIAEGHDFNYDPMGRFYDSGYSTIEELNPEVDENGMTRVKRVDWDGHDWAGSFYPLVRSGGVYRAGILEHTFYFKMVKTKRYILKINGKVVNKKTFLDKLKGDWESKYEVDVEEIDLDQKVRPGVETVELPISKMYQGKRLGHSVLMNVKEYEYANPTNGRKMGWPLIADISREKSLARVGESYIRRINIIYQRIDEILATMGHSRVVMLDETQESNPVSFLYNMKKTGIARYNSSKSQGGNIMAQRHLQILDLGENAAEVERLMSVAGLFYTLYLNTVGASEQAQGVYQRYAGLQQTQLNIENQNTLLQRQFVELSNFMGELLQRTADVAMKFYADDEERTFVIGKEEQVVLKSVRDMSLMQMNIKLENGLDLAQKKSKIEQAASQVLSSAGVEFLEPFLDIMLQDNVEEGRALLREGIAVLKKLELTNQERQLKAQEAQNAIMAQRNELEMSKEKEKTARAIKVQELKNEDSGDARLHEGEMAEYDAQNQRDSEVLQMMGGQTVR